MGGGGGGMERGGEAAQPRALKLKHTVVYI